MADSFLGIFPTSGKGPTDKEPARVISFFKIIIDDNDFNLAHFCVIDHVIIQDIQCFSAHGKRVIIAKRHEAVKAMSDLGR